ncbi:uncharacterized protein V1516DRAFT_676704 [Lipomyces oligophaga]|uniref:uncharacterized protein n=1 Tax=Lipomyces oligophaga TaxID=45792 RepID=UPI0034CFF7CA
MSNPDPDPVVKISDKESKDKTEDESEDEPDEWDKRIEDTGCAAENMKLTDCYADNGRDWRKCVTELHNLKYCWDRKNNNERTSLRP